MDNSVKSTSPTSQVDPSVPWQGQVHPYPPPHQTPPPFPNPYLFPTPPWRPPIQNSFPHSIPPVVDSTKATDSTVDPNFLPPTINGTSEPPLGSPGFIPGSSQSKPVSMRPVTPVMSLYRTRMCAKLRDGVCSNGENCTFAHSAEELRSGGVQGSGQSLGLDGGSGQWDPKGRVCRKFLSGSGLCQYGDRCVFSHDESVANGNKTSGDKPMNWRTRICVKWDDGACPFGDRCHFAHGMHEIQPSVYETTSRAQFNVQVPEPQSRLASDGGKQQAAQLPADTHASLSCSSLPESRSKSTESRDKSKIPDNWKGPREISTIYGDWIEDFEWEGVLTSDIGVYEESMVENQKRSKRLAGEGFESQGGQTDKRICIPMKIEK